MTKDTLRNLSVEDLTKLIELLELDVDISLLAHDNLQLRLEIEEMIFDELEEIRQDREKSSTFPVRYQERRYSSIEDLFGLDRAIDFGNFVFPELYNVTRIVLMLRDPEWAFAYWDISLQDRNRITEDERDGDLELVFQELGPQGEELGRVEIPVALDDTKWYINIPRRGTRYCLSLGLRSNQGFEELCRSGTVAVPMGTISPHFAEGASMETELVMALSNVLDLGVSSYEDLPARLLKYRDGEKLY